MKSLILCLVTKLSRWVDREVELLDDSRRYYVGAHWQELAFTRYRTPAWHCRRAETNLIRY